MKQLIFGFGIVVIVGVAAMAFATNSVIRPAGATIDKVTFEDGTVASSAYVGGFSSSNVVVIQIKQPDGKVCYGITMQGSAGGAGVSCLP